MFLRQSKLIVQHATPMLISQLSSMGMMIVDTVLLGHYGTADLAAVAVGGGIYIAILFALAGILQAISPTVAHLKGAGRDHEIAGALQQCFWLALLLSVPGVLLLQHPDAFLALSDIEPVVEAKARRYLDMLAWGIPAALFYRAFYSFCNAIGQPRPLMMISFGCTSLHAVLAWLLVTGGLGGEALGLGHESGGGKAGGSPLDDLATLHGGLLKSKNKDVAIGLQAAPRGYAETP